MSPWTCRVDRADVARLFPYAPAGLNWIPLETVKAGPEIWQMRLSSCAAASEGSNVCDPVVLGQE